MELQKNYKEFQELRNLAKIYLIVYIVICLLSILVYIIFNLIKEEGVKELTNKIVSIFSGITGIVSLLGGLSSLKSFFSKNKSSNEQIKINSINSFATDPNIWIYKDIPFAAETVNVEPISDYEIRNKIDEIYNKIEEDLKEAHSYSH
ncbi:11599_t:CDS:2 [Dentiscutata heterogama]|uniref:11599_t:CDS:1 n=1 Tax=Dentiscutata heterogama TaxID=1316150 RepID=A0ACA9JZF4_9GLOM|nr:11599_t:CDS:2 [Dentiscutata heterogama]